MAGGRRRCLDGRLGGRSGHSAGGDVTAAWTPRAKARIGTRRLRRGSWMRHGVRTVVVGTMTGGGFARRKRSEVMTRRQTR